MNGSLRLCALIVGLVFIGSAQAADATAVSMTKHQMMKACMAKQRASDSGMSKEDMKRACRDVTATENENAKAERSADKDHVTPKTVTPQP